MDINSPFEDRRAEHLNRALDLIMSAMNPLPPPNIYRDASLSLCSESIAQHLSDAAHLKVGAEPRPLSTLIPAQREWFRKLAEKAVRTTEPGCYADFIESTVGSMLNAQFSRRMDTEELIRETLATFLAEMSR